MFCMPVSNGGPVPVERLGNSDGRQHLLPQLTFLNFSASYLPDHLKLLSSSSKQAHFQSFAIANFSPRRLFFAPLDIYTERSEKNVEKMLLRHHHEGFGPSKISSALIQETHSTLHTFNTKYEQAIHLENKSTLLACLLFKQFFITLKRRYLCYLK